MGPFEIAMIAIGAVVGIAIGFAIFMKEVC